MILHQDDFDHELFVKKSSRTIHRPRVFPGRLLRRNRRRPGRETCQGTVGAAGSGGGVVQEKLVVEVVLMEDFVQYALSEPNESRRDECKFA